MIKTKVLPKNYVSIPIGSTVAVKCKDGVAMDPWH